MIVISAETISEAWIKLAQELCKKELKKGWKSRKLENVFVEIKNPKNVDQKFHNLYKNVLGKEWVEDYGKLYVPLSSKPRKSPRKGTFEKRLLSYGKRLYLLKCPHCGKSFEFETSGVDQLENILLRINKSFSAPDKCVVIFDPVEDAKKLSYTIPGLVSLIFNVNENKSIDIIAQFRAQDLVRKVYGNYMWLKNLMEYISEKTNMELGKLYCVSGSVFVRKDDEESFMKILNLLEVNKISE